MRNANNTDWVKYFSLDGTYISTTTSGFDITTQYGVQNKWLALRYDFADHKLKLYDTNTTGVETLITTATVAEDGNAIRIGVGGNGNVPAASTVLRYYGWEYIHTPTNHPQPWRNWRLDRPTPNDTLRNDTGLRQLRALIPGYFMRWTSADTATSNFHGGWKSSNASTGLTNIDQSPPMWDWGWRISSSEMIIDLSLIHISEPTRPY